MENKEKKIFYDWSCRYSGGYSFPKADNNVESYFVGHEGYEYISEYGLETIADLKRELERMWFGDECMEGMVSPVAVAAMKNKPQGNENREEKNVLDDFIYIF